MAEETPAAPTDSASLESIADQLVSEMPEPQLHAIEEARRADAPQGESNVQLDALGIPWDANIHATGADGAGVRTRSGAWRNRRGAKGTASQLRTRSSGTGGNNGGTGQGADKTPEQAANDKLEGNRIAARQTGAMLSVMFMNVAIGIGGDEWRPRETPAGNEAEMLKQAFGDYCEAKNFTDLPPGVALCFVLTIYALPRFAMPVTKSRAKRFFVWTKEKLFGWIARRKARKSGKPVKLPPAKPAEQTEMSDDGHAAATDNG